MPETRLARCRDLYRCPLCGLSTMDGEHGVTVQAGWRHEPEIGCRVKMVVRHPSKLGVMQSAGE